MRDDRRRLVAWGFLAAVFATAALLSATALFGSDNRLAMRLLGGALSAVSLILGTACLGLVGRGVIHTALTGVGSRLKTQTDHLLETQNRHHAELMAKLAQADERSQATLQGINDALQAAEDRLESLRLDGQMASRSLHVQGEKIATIREQTRASRVAAVDGRETTKKLLNVVRSESKNSRQDSLWVAAEIDNLRGRFVDIEAGQRRALNFLRREGSVQIVLDRLEASERRMLNSVEGGALTVAEELSDSTVRAHAGLRDELLAATQGLESIIRSDQDENAPRMEGLLGKIGGIAQGMDQLSGAIAELGVESSRALERLEDLVTGSFTRVDASLRDLSPLRDDVRALAKNSLDSQAGVEQFSDTLHNGFHDLQTRWDALQHAVEGTQNTAHTEPKAIGKDQITALAPAVASLVRLTDVLKNDVKALHRHVDRAGVETVRQTEALMQLLPRMKADLRRLPASGGFAMAPDSLLLLSDLIAENQPKRILEIGSGTSTIWIGSFAASIASSVISIDHLEEYRARTQKNLCDFGLGGTVDLRLAEMKSVDVMGENKKWYDLDALQDLSNIDLMVVDGPPESTGPAPRSPAFPLLRAVLSDHALIVVDDVHRDQEAQMVEEWLDLDPDLKRTNFEVGRTVVLEYRRNNFTQTSAIE